MNVGIFFQCIEAVHNVSPEGFAAIKVTALGLPAILERFSKAILETQHLFKQLDKDGTGMCGDENYLAPKIAASYFGGYRGRPY